MFLYVINVKHLSKAECGGEKKRKYFIYDGNGTVYGIWFLFNLKDQQPLK
jgi:hypothetical protein